jgi:hypothetical protein
MKENFGGDAVAVHLPKAVVDVVVPDARELPNSLAKLVVIRRCGPIPFEVGAVGIEGREEALRAVRAQNVERRTEVGVGRNKKDPRSNFGSGNGGH